MHGRRTSSKKIVAENVEILQKQSNQIEFIVSNEKRKRIQINRKCFWMHLHGIEVIHIVFML